MNSNSDRIPQIFLEWWMDLTSKFSKMRLTKPEDKLPALSGIARRVVSVLQQSSSGYQDIRYLAGLWDFKLIDQLVW